MEKLREKLKNIPKQPGVYQFINKDGEVIYVGKAKNLKNRVGQYFSGHDNRPQLPYLMAEAADFSYTVVDSELESLFLESTLIKKYLPRYNIMLRDDKNYAFITIDYNYEIPKISYARKFERGSKQIKYFGPYSAAWKIRNTLNLVRRIFPYCAAEKVSGRPCFYYYLHRCPGVCVGKISLDEYKLQLDRICWFLSGNTGKITRELKNEMKIVAAGKQFEKAARLRDQLLALELLEERQNVIMAKPVNWDIVSIAEDSGYACVNLFKIREGKMQDKENFIYETPATKLESNNTTNDYKAEMAQSFLEQYYLETSNAPKCIYTQIAAEDPELIAHIIRSRFGHKAEISSPQKGKPKELAELGIINAREHLKNWLAGQAGHLDKINESLEQLKVHLHLEKIPERIECYDISNTQGTNPVGSMVVFKQGLPAKSDYRKFKIQGKKTPDDFAMMKEMLQRRLARLGSVPIYRPSSGQPINGRTTQPNTWPIPDLIVIDGGKGQLGIAVEVLKAKKLNIPVIGLAKRIEEIFFPGNPQPLILPQDDTGLQLLQRLRDEAHRFGITFHRQLRSKQAVKSALDDIPGIGPKTKKLLKEKFGTVSNIRKTKFDDLAAVVGGRIAQVIQENL
jgi:excinuclease ABC subunit C